MKKIFSKGLLVGLFTLLILAGLYGISWIVTCGILKAIALCFGWSFDWGVATGIWLIMCIVKLLVGSSGKE